MPQPRRLVVQTQLDLFGNETNVTVAPQEIRAAGMSTRKIALVRPWIIDPFERRSDQPSGSVFARKIDPEPRRWNLGHGSFANHNRLTQTATKVGPNQLEGAILPTPKIGDRYFMDYRLRHTGTPNNSEAPRPILYLVYSRRWFMDRRNYDIQKPLMMTPSEYENIPEEHRSLFEIVRPAP